MAVEPAKEKPVTSSKPVAKPTDTTLTASSESRLMAENLEYFDGKPGTTETHSTGSSFAGTGLDYVDYVAKNAIDPASISSHAEFVRDRFKHSDTQNATGRTWSPDSHDSYDPIPWQGLRRPQGVAVHNPTQVPDVDYSLYSSRNKLVFG